MSLCKKCDNPIDSSNKFCPNCGEKIELNFISNQTNFEYSKEDDKERVETILKEKKTAVPETKKKYPMNIVFFLVALFALFMSFTKDNVGSSGIDEGDYKVGQDISAGLYKLYTNKGNNGYFQISSDANGNDIAINGNFNGFAYVEVKENTYLELSGCYAIPFDDAEPYKPENGIYQSGNRYKVGFDIPAGEYVVSSVSDDGYYAISRSANGESIISNDNFSNEAYIYISEGEYLILSSAQIIEDKNN